MYVHLPMYRERKQEEIGGFFCGFVFSVCVFWGGLFL